MGFYHWEETFSVAYGTVWHAERDFLMTRLPQIFYFANRYLLLFALAGM